jgi:hypothetical protein
MSGHFTEQVESDVRCRCCSDQYSKVSRRQIFILFLEMFLC